MKFHTVAAAAAAAAAMAFALPATAGNILDARSTWDRLVFLDRRDGPVDFIERRDRLIGPIVSFQIRGRF